MLPVGVRTKSEAEVVQDRWETVQQMCSSCSKNFWDQKCCVCVRGTMRVVSAV